MLRTWISAMLSLAMLSGSAVAQDQNKSADVRAVWFTNGSVMSGQRYVGHPENVLPRETKQFSKATDKSALLIIVLNGANAHAITGELKDANNHVKRRMKVDLQSTAPGMQWRFTSYRFQLENLPPGEYKLALVVDGTPAGTYPLSIVS